MSEIVEFYAGRKKDWRGRRLEDVWAYSHDQLEHVHHFIQWLFPLRTPGVYPSALLDNEAVDAFRASPELQARLLRSFDVMLDFYGLRREGDAVVRGENFPKRSAHWLSPGNHNYLRVSRILGCLRELGLPGWARAFLACLEGVYAEHARVIGPGSLGYWREAAGGPARGPANRG
jgi:hypothetical protein